MKKIRVELVLLVFMFAIMTFFFIVMINQAKINDVSNLYYNNFYSQNAVRFKLSKSMESEGDKNLWLDPSNLSGSFVLYNALEDNFSVTYDIDRVRVVYAQGNSYPKPNIIAGRFFTEEDFLSDELLCVVGMTTFDREVTSDGYYTYYDPLSGRKLKCKVIGVMGMKGGAVSDVDVTVMINWNGYYNGFDRMSGTFYFDSDSKYVSDSVFYELSKKVDEYCDTENKFTATEMLLVGNIRSFSYFTLYLFMLGAVIFTINIIMVSLRYCDSQKRNIAIKKLCGYSGLIVYGETTALIGVVSVIGLGMGLAATALMRISVDFRYSETGYYTELAPDVVFLVCISVIIYSLAVAVFPSVKAYSTDTSTALK